MKRPGYREMQRLGKAWATVPGTIKPVGYIKEGRTPVSVVVCVYCRGIARAAGRRKYKTLLKAAR